MCKLVRLQVKSLRSGKILEEGQQLLGYKGWESSTVLLLHAHLYARNPTPTAEKKIQKIANASEGGKFVWLDNNATTSCQS